MSIPFSVRAHFSERESYWQESWEKDRIYAWDPERPRDQTFVIDTPPPTISGSLHIGHIFSYVQTDFIARYQRMRGKTVFYPMGFDNNGLPTERLVEKTKNIRAVTMPRAEFINACKEVVASAEKEFKAIFTSIALSIDWEQHYTTISDQSRILSQLSFLDLLEKKKIYRTLQPTLWDPADRTALAQADVEDKETASLMHTIFFTLKDDQTPLSVATTRPELLPACVALFFHPTDVRFQKLSGKYAYSPLWGVKVPLYPDEHVDPEKGTGLVMCCTFGDMQDKEWWIHHHLPARVIIDATGRIHNLENLGKIPEWESIYSLEILEALKTAFEGKTIKEARLLTVALLKERNQWLEEKPVTQMVKCAERSGCPLEILLTPQWCVSVLEAKEDLKIQTSKIEWHPSSMKIRLDQWIDGLQWDWCISRQRYFGIPFPVWYSKRPGEEGKILTANPASLPVDPLIDLPEGYMRDEIVPDLDVMDTWATSSITPQLNSHGVTSLLSLDPDRHVHLFPADLRTQAHEIIRTWAFYTIVKAWYHEKTIPWSHIMISGWCLASDKTKMSKSKGNVVTPQSLIKDKGADIIRYWAANSHLGADTVFSEDILTLGHKLTTKLWNACKFAALHIHTSQGYEENACHAVSKKIIIEPTDLWIISVLQNTIKTATDAFEIYEYSKARHAVERFFWDDVCDNYLEFVKKRIYAEDASVSESMKQSAIHTVYFVFEAILKLFAPFIPHVTEELYQSLFPDLFLSKKSIHAHYQWPLLSEYVYDKQSVICGNLTVIISNAVRKAKAELKLSPKAPLCIIYIKASEKSSFGKEDLAHFDIMSVTHTEQLLWTEEKIHFPDDIWCTEEENITVGVVFK